MNHLLIFSLMLCVASSAETPVGTKPTLPPAPMPLVSRIVSLDKLISSLDANNDGKISKDEATGAFAQRFAQWDTNKDGLATREEIYAYRAGVGINDDGSRDAAASATPSATPKTAVVLNEPADWRLETMSVPPGFAHDVKLKGSEEIRFAPGMFDNTSDTYFTCIIALTVDGEVGVADLKDFLEKYYRGLSIGVGQRKGFKIDPAQMIAEVSAVPDSKNRFTASIDFFDSFSDGRKIKLNIEASTFAKAAKTILILLVSPSAKDGKVWSRLREISKSAERNASTAQGR